ncbi:hypothetical protein BJV82DRAFT_595521 [Fennellomyces sp. T-0311]|nr:hypothetical protein BJV82DRAFT_595521 [Fennellomyces sp. T-0311]
MTIPKFLWSQYLKEPRFQPLQVLWENVKTSFDFADYPDAVQSLTAAVVEIEQNVLAVTLLKRAIAFGRQDKLQAGIKDAYKVIELAPALFEGYLCAGNLLQLAGESSKAVAVYKKGLGAVSSQSPEYEELARVMKALESQIHETNTMLFKKLPFELLAYIFGNLLSFHDRLGCMFTCHAWLNFFLEDLPRVSPQVVLGTMPKDSMARLLQTISARRQGNLPTRGVQQVSILPGTSATALGNALDLLSQNSWHGRIGYLDICADLDAVPDMKLMLGRLLQQNNENLKRVTLCSVKDTRATVDTLNVCSKLSHLVIAAHHSLLMEDTSSMTTRSRRKVSSGNTSSTAVTNDYARERLLAAARAMGGPNPLISANPNWLVEQQLRAMHQREMQSNFPQTHHLALKRLELVGMEVGYFVQLNFWERLPNLEHISFKDPVDYPGNLQSVTRNIGQYCRKLKRLRYGSGWHEDSFCNENGVIPVVDEEAQEQEGLREIFVRNSIRSKVRLPTHAMIIPNLISEGKSYNVLTMLVLQMEAITMTGLQTLTSLHLPRLKEFQLHQWRFIEAYSLRPELFAPIASHFPALEKVILNNIQADDDTLFELSKAQRLRFAHLKVGGVSQMNENRNLPRRLAMRQLLLAQRQNAAIQNPTGNAVPTGVPPPPLPVARILPTYDVTTNIYTKFINNCTMLTDVSLYGPTVQDADLCSLMTHNRNLSTLNLILCSSLTSGGFASAFNCAGDGIFSTSYPANIRNITLAYMHIEGEAVMTSLTPLSSLKKLTIICCTFQDGQRSIVTRLKYDRSRKNALKVYCLQNLTAPEGILYEYIPSQRSVMTRPVPSVAIVKPLADLL